MNAQTQRVDVLAAIDLADAWLIEEGYNLKSRRPLKEARAAVADIVAERDALREVLREYQDARRFSNLHTRQVAREIEQTALARVSGGAP